MGACVIRFLYRSRDNKHTTWGLSIKMFLNRVEFLIAIYTLNYVGLFSTMHFPFVLFGIGIKVLDWGAESLVVRIRKRMLFKKPFAGKQINMIRILLKRVRASTARPRDEKTDTEKRVRKPNKYDFKRLFQNGCGEGKILRTRNVANLFSI